MPEPKCEDCMFFEEDVGDPNKSTHGCQKLNIYTDDARISLRCGPTGKLFIPRILTSEKEKL
jgi:hypothetical protein